MLPGPRPWGLGSSCRRLPRDDVGGLVPDLPLLSRSCPAAAGDLPNQLLPQHDYLQAVVAVSAPERLSVLKLLQWYPLGFAKYVDSLMDWACLQLLSELRCGPWMKVDTRASGCLRAAHLDAALRIQL